MWPDIDTLYISLIYLSHVQVYMERRNQQGAEAELKQGGVNKKKCQGAAPGAAHTHALLQIVINIHLIILVMGLFKIFIIYI